MRLQKRPPAAAGFVRYTSRRGNARDAGSAQLAPAAAKGCARREMAPRQHNRHHRLHSSGSGTQVLRAGPLPHGRGRGARPLRQLPSPRRQPSGEPPVPRHSRDRIIQQPQAGGSATCQPSNVAEVCRLQRESHERAVSAGSCCRAARRRPQRPRNLASGMSSLAEGSAAATEPARAAQRQRRRRGATLSSSDLPRAAQRSPAPGAAADAPRRWRGRCRSEMSAQSPLRSRAQAAAATRSCCAGEARAHGAAPCS